MRNFGFLLLSLFAALIPTFASAMPAVDYQYYLITKTIFEFRQVKSVEEFTQKYARTWKEEDLKAFRKASKTMKRWPTAEQDGTVLVLTTGRARLRVDFREIARKVLYIGKARVELNQYEPYLQQIKRALAQDPEFESAIYRALVPEAEALPQLLVIPLAFVGVAIANKLVDRYGDRVLDATEYGACYLGIEQAQWEYMKTTKVCEKYIEAQKKVVAENPTVLAAKPALVDTKPAESPIKTAGENCGQIGDATKGKQEYRAIYQVIKENLELRVRGQVDGLKLGVTEMFDVKTDKLAVRFKANADNTLSEIWIPNPKRVGDQATNPDGSIIPAEISLPLVGTIEDPELASLRTMYLRVYQHFGDRLGACKTNNNEKIAGEAKRQEQKGREGTATESRQ